MKTVSELAKELDVSVQTIYRMLNRVKQDGINGLTEKTNNITYITSDGERIIEERLTPNKQDNERVLNNVEHELNNIIAFLKEQIALKDTIISEKDNIIASKDEYIKEINNKIAELTDKLAVLLENSQQLQQNQQLLTARTADEEGNNRKVPLFLRIFRKK